MSYFSKKRFSLRQIVFLLSIVFAGIAVISYATVNIPNTFTSGTTISSSQVNSNFTALAIQMPGISWTTISQSNIDVRTSMVTLATVTVHATTSGYVVVRFDGYANADTGDRLVLAASNVADYGINDGHTQFEGDGDGHPFSHTRVYTVASGSSTTFYAVAYNSPVHRGGDGIASVYGTLTATFYPRKNDLAIM